MRIYEKIVIAVFVTVFATVSSWLLWSETAEIHLKSGIKMFENNDPASVEVLGNGVKKDSENYLLRYYLAKSLMMTVEKGKANFEEQPMRMIEAVKHLNEAQWIRSDAFGFLTLASIHEKKGDNNSVLANLNLSYFYSQQRGEIGRWRNIIEKQAGAAEYYFNDINIGIALIISFNHLSGYNPQWNKNEAGKLLAEFFLAMPPVIWNKRIISDLDNQNKKTILKNIYKQKSKKQKENIVKQFTESELGFLNEFLSSGTVI